jgi:hypothetical protein
MTENERFGLVFAKTGSINSGTVLYIVAGVYAIGAIVSKKEDKLSMLGPSGPYNRLTGKSLAFADFSSIKCHIHIQALTGSCGFSAKY